MTDTYLVWAQDCSGPEHFLGCAKGEEKDIEAYFEEKKIYGLRLQKLEVINLEKGYAQRKQDLLTKKADLQSQIDELNKRIRLGV